MVEALLFLLSFLSGSIPFGYLLGKLRGVNIKNVGSGNIGATNASRVLGKKYGFAVLVLDALKGLLPVLVASVFGFPYSTQIATGVLAILGHCFSPFLSFKGGKGVATSLGVFLFLSPKAVFVSVVIFLLVVSFSRYVSLGSVVVALFFPFLFYIFGSRDFADVFLVAFTSLVIIFKHRSNILRLLRGEERKFF